MLVLSLTVLVLTVKGVVAKNKARGHRAKIALGRDKSSNKNCSSGVAPLPPIDSSIESFVRSPVGSNGVIPGRIIIYSQKGKKLLHRFWRQEKGKKVQQEANEDRTKKGPRDLFIERLPSCTAHFVKNFCHRHEHFWTSNGSQRHDAARARRHGLRKETRDRKRTRHALL